VDEALRIVREGGASIVSFNMNEEDVQTLMRQPWTMTASDGDLVPWEEGVPHPRSYGTFPWKIQHYVVDEGVVSLEEAVRSMTSLPAQVFRMADRGLLEPGRVADLVVFDLDAFRSPATFTDPHQLAEGVTHLLVNGEPAIREGEFQDPRHGRVLRKR
jgi:N-acyl-D-aspartate/D-glutamate deacylase